MSAGTSPISAAARYAASLRLSVAPMMDWTDSTERQALADAWYIIGSFRAAICSIQNRRALRRTELKNDLHHTAWCRPRQGFCVKFGFGDGGMRR